MKKNIINMEFFLIFVFYHLNLSCMSSLDGEAKILSALKFDRKAKVAEMVVEILHSGSSINFMPKIGNSFGRNFDKKTIENFFEFEVKDALSEDLIEYDSEYCKCALDVRLSPFVCDTWGELLSKRIKNKLKNDFSASNNVIEGKNSLYLMQVCNNKVRIIKKSNNNIVFNAKFNGVISKIGTKIYFDRNLRVNKNSYGIEYVLLIFSANKKDNCECVCLYDKDLKIKFKKEFDKKISSYQIIESGESEFIALIFDNSVVLFDLKTGVKKCETDRESFVFFVVDYINYKSEVFSLSHINSEKPVIGSCNSRQVITSAIAFKNYVAFISKGIKSCEINFVGKGENRFIKSFNANFDDSLGVIKDLEHLKEFYVWKKSVSGQKLKLYCVYEDIVKKIFYKKFKDKVLDFKIDKNMSKGLCRNLCIYLSGFEKESFQLSLDDFFRAENKIVNKVKNSILN